MWPAVTPTHNATVTQNRKTNGAKVATCGPQTRWQKVAIQTNPMPVNLHRGSMTAKDAESIDTAISVGRTADKWAVARDSRAYAPRVV